MSLLHDCLTNAKNTGNWQPMLDAIPYAKWLGLTLDVRGGSPICKMTFDPKLVGNSTIPALHGGTLGGLLESAAVFQLLWSSESVVLPKVVNITVDYLRSARAVDTYATGEVFKQGRRVTLVRAVAWQEDRNKPVAAANAHFLVYT
jgi:uncharacterized protein (TIGR00369 family)